MQLHRNAVFVIERANLIDSAYNIALKPADIVMSTSIGKEVSHRVHPYVAVAEDLIMPAVVCVAMYCTNGLLESDAKFFGRTEGVDLWHFS